MKKLLLICTLCFLTIVAKAQQNKELAEFDAYTSKAKATMTAAYVAKDYSKAITIINDWFTAFDQKSAEFKKSNSVYMANMYYDLACNTALKGETDNALKNLKRAYDTGYRDYKNMVNDADLVSLHNEQQYKDVLQLVRERSDYGYLLKKAGTYDVKQKAKLPVFTYQSANAPALVAFRKQFNLDSVSGNGDEISKIKNLLYWVHNVVKHDGNSNNPKSKNAADLITVCRKDERGLNCRMMATILKDAYQAEGFKARLVTCMPKDTADFDCHVITVVWSRTLNKWVWMDPTFNAYVSDEKGNLLNIEEVRKRLIDGGPLILNKDANWNNQVKQTKEDYLGRYMSKNLYWLKCSVKSEWDLETRTTPKVIEYINLYPGNFSTIHHQPKETDPDVILYASNNPSYFWQKPKGEK